MIASQLPRIHLRAREKVRDLYDVGKTLLMVATDRVSTFDVVLDDPIPGKGIVLTRLSAFWLQQTRPIWQNHFLTAEVEEYPAELRAFTEVLRGRSMLCLPAEKLPFECVARGYLAGSAWAEYRDHGTVAGLPLPTGLRENDQLPKPIFTPAIKAEVGHDLNITIVELASRVGEQRAAELSETTLRIYGHIRDYAAARGIIVADTKLEFGTYRGQLIVIDEVGTPDSSRFWPSEAWQPGKPVPSLDKQPLRDYLAATGWNKEPPPPRLPADVIRETSERYQTIMRLLLEAARGDD